MTVRTRPRRRDVRERVLTAAHREFLARGYAGTTLADIATAAGFTKGAVYSNFGSKPELFGEVCRHEFETRTSAILTVVAPALQSARGSALPVTLAAALTEVVLTRGAWLATMDEFRSMALRDSAVGEVYARVRAGVIDELAGILAEHGVLGEQAGPVACTEVAVIVLGQLNFLAAEHAAAPTTMTAELIGSTLHRLAAAVLA